MNIIEYKKLESKINNQNFNQGYKTINLVMLVLSYLGHIASIFLAYFLLSKILSGVMTDSPIVVLISSVVILSGVEILKRDLFCKFSTQYLKLKTIGKDVMPLFLLSIVVIGISFYASISGAKEFSSKSKELDTNKKEILTHYKDSVGLIYNTKIKSVEDEIILIKDKIEKKDKEQTDIASVQPQSKTQRSRVNDLKKEIPDLKLEKTKLENDILNIEKARDSNVKTKEDELSLDTNEKKDDNSSNSIMFIIISTMIELLILAGVYFHEYYRFRSYKEFKTKIDNDPNYQKWVLYESILNVVYTSETRINDKLSSTKNIIDLCKLNNILLLQKDINDFLKLMVSLNIIKTSGSSRYVIKQRDISFDTLKKHFNIE